MGDAHDIQVGHIIQIKGQAGKFVVTGIDSLNGFCITGSGSVTQARWPMSWCSKVQSGLYASDAPTSLLDLAKHWAKDKSDRDALGISVVPKTVTIPGKGLYEITVPKGYKVDWDSISTKDSHNVYTGTNSIFKWPENTGKSDWQYYEGVDTSKTPVCECGSHKTYGNNCSSDIHSTYCPIYKKV